MSHTFNRHFLSAVFLAAAVSTASAQNSNKENAPYSRYGIGELRTGTNISLRGMGSTTTAYSNPFSVNTENPASYSFLKLTTYEAGGEASTRNLTSGGVSYGTGSATLSYINIGIPLGKHGGMAFGLKPQSKVYYKLQDTTNFNTEGGPNNQPIPGMGKNLNIYSGDGGLNYAFVGGAATYGGFSIGFNFGYMFGTVRNSSVLQQTDTFLTYSSEFTRYTKMGGIYYKLGAMYETPVSKNMKLRLGATAALGQNINGWRDDYWVQFRFASDGTTLQDTSYHSAEAKGKIALPLTYSFGAQLAGNDKWAVNLDFSSAQWNQYRNYGVKDSVADQTYRLAAGAEYTPNPSSIYNYLQRVTYRLGAYYGSDYVSLRGTTLNYYAVTVGASLPFRRGTDRIHTALELGRRGTETNGLIRENFVRFSLGISLNDKWFIKRKYD